MVKSVIEPYFRKKAVTLQGLEARHIQQFYSEKLKTVKPNSVIHYHAVIHQALKYAMKTDLVTQNVAMKVDRPEKNDYQPVFLDAEELQHLFEVVKGTEAGTSCFSRRFLRLASWRSLRAEMGRH